MQVKIELSASDVRKLVCAEIQKRIEANFDPLKVVIETRSKQNYKAEWERSDFRVSYCGEI